MNASPRCRANKMLIAADRKSKERKQVVDKLAAALDTAKLPGPPAKGSVMPP